MKVMLILCCSLLVATSCLWAQTTNGASTVYLKDGRTVTGTILGDLSGESVKVRTDDGSILVFQMSEVNRISDVSSDQPMISGTSTPPSQVMQTQPTGSQPPMAAQFTRKDPSSALLYSILLTGGGQFYNGDASKGLIQLGGTVLGLILFVAYFPESDWVADDYYWASYGYETESGDEFLSYGGLALALGMKVWSLIDAPSGARKFNERHGLVSLPVGSDRVYVNVENIRVSGGSTLGMRVGLSF